MDVLVAGAHGGIGGRLVRLLARDGHRVFATVRREEQFDEVAGDGIEPVLLDVTDDVPGQLSDAGIETVDAIVYSIGAGAGSGPEKKKTVDRDGSNRLVDWAESHGVVRYLLVSSHGAHDPSIASGDFVAYLEAKKEADERLMASGLDWTIVRPGSLDDDEGDGRVALPSAEDGGGTTSRDDVAAFLAAAVAREDLGGVVTELTDGDVPIADALDRLAGRG